MSSEQSDSSGFLLLAPPCHFVESEIKAGKTKEEILKATAVPGAPEWKGDGIERPLTAAYEELTA